ncbi:Clan SC, family S9, unassigned serine peptidase [Histomonas meleagridis]|uniref:Clan SC, family S9, unassigned serine peptidase n=1 Tax=Histomonas meleagridis TaxID=135588 RepID=UPI00355AC839|nr:Clan SC, family S9, unassigned serine peptidase [Histomonas meleagridis]KAH0802487.1 Clan SC, family S9, unassigned serine peptidase [Histomonas meleagridis]
MTTILSKIIARPPRRNYNDNDLKDEVTLSNGRSVTRHPVSFPNKKGLTIVGSYYQSPSSAPGNPCVIYLHGNASSQEEGSYLVYYLCPEGVNLLCIDTSGCGKSGGDYITLGLYEREDVFSSMEYIRKEFGVGPIILWGRSMGAAISAWCASDGYDITGIIVDSGYCSIKSIADDLCGNSWILWGLKTLLMPVVNWSVKRHYHFSIYDVDILSNVKKAKCPALFVHCFHDTFINVREARELYRSYGGKKYLLTTSGDHNSTRPKSVRITELQFILNLFDIDKNDNFDISEENELNDNSSRHFENAFEMLKNI